MKPKLKVGLIASVPLALFLALGMWLGRQLGLTGMGFYLFWLGFGALGGMLAGAIFWFMGRLKAGREGPVRPPLEEDLIARFAEIRKRLDSAQRPGINRLPTILLLGPPQSGKSSSILGSEVAAEQLSGDRFGGMQPPPTKSINAWYSDGTVFLEAGEALRDDASLWAQLLQRIRPKRLLAAVLMGKAQAPRAVIVCFPCSELRQNGGSDAAESWGRALRSSLLELSKRLGVPVPVYVLFTKADEIPSFSEYCAHLKDAGAGQVLGTTLPLPATLEAASYADRQSRALNVDFDGLFRSLAVKRLKVLDPDLSSTDATTAYEFPREFQKLSGPASRFLVELSKPSQLQVSPFLRGFYFVGRQKYSVDASAPAPRDEVSDVVPVAGATQVFDPRRMQVPAAPARSVGGDASRAGQRWIFLPRVFRDVVLRDSLAAGLTARGQRVAFGRRLLLGAFVAVFLLFFIPYVISAFNYNRGLQTRTENALAAVGSMATDRGTDTGDRLQRLDALRQLADTLADHEARGPIGRFARWLGLFSGSRLNPRVRDEYSRLFRPLLLEPSLESVESELRGASQAGVAGDYDATYRRLRAYLMSTTDPERGEVDFLSEVLTDHWPSTRTEEDRELVRRQFDFFGRRLLQSRDFQLPQDNAQVVERSREYLRNQGGAEPFYQSLVNRASRLNEPERFDDRAFRSTSQAIRIYEPVPGAFSPSGWEYVKGLLSNPDSLPQAEEWVLGPVPILDRDELRADIDSLYSADYRNRWERLLSRAQVIPFTDADDAAEKLAELSGEFSQITLLLRAVYERSEVLPPDDFARFRALEAFFVQDSVGDIQGLSPAGMAYLDGLQALEGAMADLADAQGTDRIAAAQGILAQDVLPDAQRAADDIKREVQSRFESRDLGLHVSRILDDPIRFASNIVNRAEPSELNRRGAEFCRDYDRLVGSRFPFQRQASNEPSMDEVAVALKPPESLYWNLLNGLDEYVERVGPQYRTRETATVSINPAFLTFLGNARVFSEAVYSQATGNPEVRFALRGVLAESSRQVDSITVEINGRSETCSPTSCRTTQEFLWDGAEVSQIALSAWIGGENVLISGPFRGPWAAFRFFSGTWGWRGLEANEHPVRWRIRDSQEVVAVTVVGRVASVFNPEVMDGLRCVPTLVARRP